MRLGYSAQRDRLPGTSAFHQLKMNYVYRKLDSAIGGETAENGL
jgi:hypothetical protein